MTQDSSPLLKMHPLHDVAANRNYAFYTQKQFDQKTLTVSLDELKHLVLEPLKNNSDDFIKDRSEKALQQARRNYQVYGLKDANKAGALEACVEALTDTQFRKGTSDLYCKKTIRDQIRNAADSNSVVDIALQMLPNKVNTPIKSRNGILPCLAEISLLMRLNEICKIAENVGAKNDKPLRFRFRAVMDGFRFQQALNSRGCDIIHYQNGLHWWLDALDVKDYVSLHDYEDEVRTHLNDEIRIQQKSAFQQQAQGKIDEALSKGSLKHALGALAKEDPFGDYENGEGKLQKLFKSVLYTYHHQDFQDCFTDDDRYQNGYRTILTDIYNDDAPESEWKDMFVKRTFRAATNYMASVHTDRTMMGDPVSTLFPDALRMNLLPKKGQIGLNPLCTTRPDSMKPWHGVCLIRSSNGKTKIDSVSRLYAEGIDAVPVILDPNDLSIRNTPLAPMQEARQTLFYIEPQIAATMSIKEIFDNCTRYTK